MRGNLAAKRHKRRKKEDSGLSKSLQHSASNLRLLSLFVAPPDPQSILPRLRFEFRGGFFTRNRDAHLQQAPLADGVCVLADETLGLTGSDVPVAVHFPRGVPSLGSRHL